VRSLVLMASLLGLALPAFAGDLPKVDDVLHKVIERAAWEKKAKVEDGWAASQRLQTEKLNKDGAVEETSERRLEPVLIQGKVYHRVVAKNGQLLTGDDLKKEAKREKEFREALQKPKKADDDDDDVELDQELLSRYHFTVIKEEPVGERMAYMLTFLPRTGVKLPEKKRMDRILNRLEGRVWVDTVNYSLLKIDMHLTEPTTMLAGLGSVRSLDFFVELTAVSPDVILPKETNISFEGRQLFKSLRVKQKAYFTDYRKVSELAEAK